MMKNNYLTLIGIIIGLSLVLTCAVAAMAPDNQNPETLLSNEPVVTAVKENIQIFTGSPVETIDSITIMETAFGNVYQVTTDDGNIFNVNAESGQIEAALVQRGFGEFNAAKDLSDMETAAHAFAEKYYKNFAEKKMTLVESGIIDHGDAGKEYVFSWNAMSGEVYTLSFVSVSYFPDDNLIEYHGIDRDLLVDTTPEISKEEAQKIGERAFSMGSAAKTTSGLQVIPYGDGQALSWIVNTVEYDKIGIAHGGNVYVDAESGKVLLKDPFN